MSNENVSDIGVEEEIDYQKSFDKAVIVDLEYFEFENIKITLEDHGVEIPHIKDETMAFGANISGKPFIILNRDTFKELDDDEQKIVLAHEAAHAIAGIIDEEEADIWALGALEEKQKKMLMDMWKIRHNHKYDERKL